MLNRVRIMIALGWLSHWHTQRNLTAGPQVSEARSLGNVIIMVV